MPGLTAANPAAGRGGDTGNTVVPPRVMAIVVVALLGVLASVAVFRLALWWENRAAESDFHNRAQSYLQVIDGELQAASTLLYTFRAFFEAQDHPASREEFMRFSQDLHGRVVGLRDTGWAPRVAQAERAAFERQVRATGRSDFLIRERDSDGTLVPAGVRPVYYPILYLDSGATAQPVLGFDLASEPQRKAAIARALESHAPAATPPLKLITVKRPRGGVMGFIPVERDGGVGHGPADAASGVALGVVDIDALMEHIIVEKARLAGIDVYVFDPAGARGDRQVYWRSALSKTAPPPTERAALAATHHQGAVSLLDQQWVIVFMPAEKLDALAWNWHAIMPLIVGLTMTAMIVAYLLVSLRRTLQLERLTDELHRKTEDLHRNAERISHMARHDALTGLPNRALFRERMDEAVERLRRGVPFIVMFLDLDRFKAVNDSLGHGAGDRLLLEVAERLQTCVRQIDTVARLGGDEFAIILADASSAVFAERIAQRLIDTISAGYAIDEHTATVGASIGIALAPGDGNAAEVLLARADAALYTAKAAGRGRFCFYVAAPAAGVAPRLDLHRAGG